MYNTSSSCVLLAVYFPPWRTRVPCIDRFAVRLWVECSKPWSSTREKVEIRPRVYHVLTFRLGRSTRFVSNRLTVKRFRYIPCGETISRLFLRSSRYGLLGRVVFFFFITRRPNCQSLFYIRRVRFQCISQYCFRKSSIEVQILEQITEGWNGTRGRRWRMYKFIFKKSMKSLY